MVKVRDLVSVKREQYPFENAGDFPPEMTGSVFIPAIGAGSVHYGFLVDVAKRSITCWTIDLKKVNDRVLANLAKRGDLAVPWHQDSLAKFIEVVHFPHSADCWGEWVYLTLIEGGLMLALHAYSDAYEVIYDESVEADQMYSSTNQIRDGKIHFSRWNIEETFAHERDRAHPVALQVGVYDIAAKSFELGPVVAGPDDIHYTAVSPDRSTILLVEMSQDPVAAMDIDHLFEKLPPEEKRKVREAGVHDSELITCDVRTGEIQRLQIPGGPAHIEWDEREKDVFYLSSHCLVTNNDTLYAFGNCRIDRFRLVNGKSVLERSYETGDLLRGPSHRITSYDGAPLMAIPVYPNRIDLVNRDTMALHKRIELSRKARAKVDFEAGPVRYPPSSQEKTPYTVDAQDGTPYLYLSSVWDVTAFDFQTEKKIASVIYNRDKPVMLMGHASKFEMPRSHV